MQAKTRQAIEFAIDHLSYFKAGGISYDEFRDKWMHSPADSDEVIKRLREVVNAGNAG